MLSPEEHIKEIEKQIISKMSSMTIDSIDRATFINFIYVDRDNNVSVNVIFHRSWSDKEVIIQAPVGMVMLVPNFWLNVSKNVSLPYLMEDIIDFYTTFVAQWNFDRSTQIDCAIR